MFPVPAQFSADRLTSIRIAITLHPHIPFKVADLQTSPSSAARRSASPSIEMPGLMAVRERYQGKSKPLAGVRRSWAACT